VTDAVFSGPLVFVDVDTQRDFLEPTGALYVPRSDLILANLERLTDHARKRGIRVLATACAHTPDDPELERFRPHCLVGTVGLQRVEATAWPGSLVLGPDDRLEGELPPHLTIEKRELDLFSRADANHLVSLYRRGDPWFVVYGVATDYCVACAVLGLLERSCRVAVVADAVRAIDAAAEPGLFQEFVRGGAVLTVTGAIVDG
jgi:nicotinamidase/pyrazinamidase